MKKLRFAILLTSFGVAGWIFFVARNPSDSIPASKLATHAPIAKRDTDRNVPSRPDAPAATRATEDPQPAASAKTGKILSIPGLPPVYLEKAADLPWRTRLDTVTKRSDYSDTLKAKSLMDTLPNLAEPATVEAAQEAAALLPDADYRTVMEPTLIDPKTDHRVIAVLFADLMERPVAVALPLLLSIAKNPQHSYAPFAVQNLELILSQNLGTDWARWESAIQSYIVILRK